MATEGDTEAMEVDVANDSGFAGGSSHTAGVSNSDMPSQSDVTSNTEPASNADTLVDPNEQTETGNQNLNVEVGPGQPYIPGRMADPRSSDSEYATQQSREPLFDIRPPGANPLPTENVDRTERTRAWVEESFEVFVKDFGGKSHTVEVNPNKDVKEFREKVSQKIGVPDAQQRLTSQEGKTLQDGCKLRSCNIKKGSTIYCQGRLRGG